MIKKNIKIKILFKVIETPVLTHLGYCDRSVFVNPAVQDVQIKNEIPLQNRPIQICHITGCFFANLHIWQPTSIGKL